MLARRPDLDIDEIAADMPDVVVVEIPAGRTVRPAVEPVLEAPGMEHIPVIAVVDSAAVAETAGIAELADFAVVPLHRGELAARARRPLALVTRDDDDRIRVGGLVVDLKGYEVLCDGDAIDLTYQEFQLLKFLASNPGQAFTRDQLLSRVWGYDYYGGSRTVDIHVRRIRAKLGATYAACLQTIRHVGYKWVVRDLAVGQETSP